MSARIPRAVLAACITVVVLGASHPARAESTLVVLVGPPTNGGPGAGEILNRLRGELLADGFSVLVVDAMPQADRLTALTRAGHEKGAAVTAGVFVASTSSSIELYLVDELTGRVVVHRLETQSDSADNHVTVLARRTVDFLRASLPDFLVDSLRSAVGESRAPPPGAPPPVPSEAPSKPRWAVEAGLGILGSFEGVGPAAVPLARLRYALSDAFQLRATTAWLGTQPRVATATGTATVEQGIALLEGIAQFWHGRWLRPQVSLGAGIYHVGVNGNNASPYLGVQNSEFVFAVDLGLGVAAPIGPHLEVVLEAHGLLTEPGIAIRFLDVDAARVGRPSFLSSLALAGWI